MRCLWVGVFVAGLILSLAQPTALARKKRNASQRLQFLNTIYVDGFGQAADYIRHNLARETCLKNVPAESDADAILEIEEKMNPCGGTQTGICRGVSAKLVDPQTNEVLWFREDDELRPALSIGTPNVAPRWVIWNLKGSCCKGRPKASPSKP